MKEFFVKNYYCGAWLLMHGIKPKRIEFTPKKYRIFFYDEVQEARALIDTFYQDENLQKYIKSCLEFKDIMYSVKCNNRNDKENKANESNDTQNLH